jgi:hypothetical protein
MFISSPVHVAIVKEGSEQKRINCPSEKEISMNAFRNFALIAIVAATFAVLAPNARAQMTIQKVKVTISEPVEVPHLVLPIGTYVFEALENGCVTRILSADESHIYATLITQPNQLREPVDKPTIIFKESQEGAVERIDSWFFPGESIGSQFLYPETRADKESESKLNAFTRESGHAVAAAVEDVVAIPEYLAVHTEHAVVNASIATGRFFRANFLVN